MQKWKKVFIQQRQRNRSIVDRCYHFGLYRAATRAQRPAHPNSVEQVQVERFWYGLGILAILIQAGGWQDIFIYRSQSARTYAWWQWLTAHLTHFDWGHLLLNLLGMALLIWAFRWMVPCAVYLSSLLVAVLVIDLGLWWQEVVYYGGFSGVFYGVLMAALLCLAERPERQLRRTGQILIGGLMLRMLVEVFQLNPTQHAFAVFHPAHVWGCLGGAVGWLGWRVWPHRRPDHADERVKNQRSV